MMNCLKIIVVDPDPDYLGIEISARNGRFAGAARIYAGLDELTRFAKVLSGFPRGRDDERTHVFGTRKPGHAGGYCSLRFFCRDSAGHAAVEVEIDEEHRRHSEASARFTVSPVLAGEIDSFIAQLRSVEKGRAGEAKLESKG
jgi:hypothetical protein